MKTHENQNCVLKNFFNGFIPYTSNTILFKGMKHKIIKQCHIYAQSSVLGRVVYMYYATDLSSLNIVLSEICCLVKHAG